MSHSGTVFDIMRLSFATGTEALLRSVYSEDEANRLIAELSATNRQPSTFYYWVARRARGQAQV